METIEGSGSGAGRRLAVVVARFNDFVTEKLLTGAIAALRAAGVEHGDIAVVRVPGAFEIPLAAQHAPVATRYIINAVNKGLEMPFAEGAVFEATLFGLVASTEDMREGTAAFLEKRRPEFKGK